MKGTVAMIGVVVLLSPSCNSNPPSATEATTSSPAATTVATTTVGPTSSTVTSSTVTSSTVTSSTVTATTVTATTVPMPCDLEQATDILDATISLARLESGGAWQSGAAPTSFDQRTNNADEYGARVAYTCSERLIQRTPSGAERLALVAWNETRHAVVVQATDAPDQPYRADVRFQLFIEQPDGEWLDDQFVWAATMSGGESIVIATRDYSAAITAKSWQSSVPRFEDLPVTLESEQAGIEALIDVEARNVSVAEPAPFGSTIGTIQFNTPLALGAFAVIGPAGSFDPMVPIVPDGESTFLAVDGVEIRSTVGKELGRFDLFETGWSCGDHEWRLYAGLGSPEELAEFTATLVRSLDC